MYKYCQQVFDESRSTLNVFRGTDAQRSRRQNTSRHVHVKLHSLNNGRKQWHVAEECSLDGETSCWVTQSWVWAPSAECSSTLIMLINHSTPPTFSCTPITIYPHGWRRAQIASRKKHLHSAGKTEGKHIHHPANVRSSLQFCVPTTNLNKLRRKNEGKKLKRTFLTKTDSADSWIQRVYNELVVPQLSSCNRPDEIQHFKHFAAGASGGVSLKRIDTVAVIVAIYFIIAGCLCSP